MQTVHVIGHDPDPEKVMVSAGTFGTWAAARGVEVVPSAVHGAGPHEPLPDPRAVDAIVVLGSAEGAWDDDVGWLGQEIDHLRAAVAAGTPVLGICFGGQLLARVLGGAAQPDSGRHEHGWYAIDTRAPELIAPGPWMEFHFDTFTAPPRAEVLATSARSQQAFRLGPHLGVQFHPEVTPEEVDGWIARWAGTAFEARVVELGIDPVALRAETVARAEASRAASWVIFDGFAARARGGERMLAG